MIKVTRMLMINVIICLFCFLALLSGCSNEKGLNGVEYNKKYYIAHVNQENIDNNEASYIMFKNSNSGLFRSSVYRLVQENGVSHTEVSFCTVKFVYTKLDETSIMITIKRQDRIFDDENYLNEDTAVDNYLVLVSKNIVGISYTSNISYYFNIDYLKANNLIN